MALIKRADVPAPLALQRETVSVESLGGDVAVVELALADRLAFEEAVAKFKGSKRNAANTLMPCLLALSVLDADDEPVFDPDQWHAWAARKANRNAAIDLFNRAMSLSGFDAAENEKNS